MLHPAGSLWRSISVHFRLDDPQFVNRWRYKSALESDAKTDNCCYLRSVEVRKLKAP